MKKSKKKVIRKTKKLQRKKYSPKLSSKWKHLERLSLGEFLEFRTTTGRVVKHPRNDRKYLLVVKDKKTKKIKGFMNWYDRKTKTFIPQKTKPVFRKFLKTPVTRQKTPRPPKREIDFKLKSKTTILSQIHKVARESAKDIYYEAKREGFCVFRIRLYAMHGEPITKTLNIHAGENLYNIESIMAYSIIDALKAGMLRMSTIQLTDRPKAWMTKTLECKVQILDVSRMGIA